MFVVRGHKLASLNHSQSFATHHFCQGNIRESRGLFYVCLSEIFSNPKIISHVYLLHERKMQNVCSI